MHLLSSAASVIVDAFIRCVTNRASDSFRREIGTPVIDKFKRFSVGIQVLLQQYLVVK